MRYTSSDGLLSSSDPTAVAQWESITARAAGSSAEWTTLLRDLGVKLAHPDDGWVRRHKDGSGTFTVSWYPQFNDRPQVGDLIAFGRPPAHSYRVDHYVPRVPRGEGESACQGYRIARVTDVDDHTGILGRIVKYTYEDTGLRLPQVPKRSGWRSTVAEDWTEPGRPDPGSDWRPGETCDGVTWRRCCPSYHHELHRKACRGGDDS